MTCEAPCVVFRYTLRQRGIRVRPTARKKNQTAVKSKAQRPTRRAMSKPSGPPRLSHEKKVREALDYAFRIGDDVFRSLAR